MIGTRWGLEVTGAVVLGSRSETPGGTGVAE